MDAWFLNRIFHTVEFADVETLVRKANFKLYADFWLSACQCPNPHKVNYYILNIQAMTQAKTMFS